MLNVLLTFLSMILAMSFNICINIGIGRSAHRSKTTNRSFTSNQQIRFLALIITNKTVLLLLNNFV